MNGIVGTPLILSSHYYCDIQTYHFSEEEAFSGSDVVFVSRSSGLLGGEPMTTIRPCRALLTDN